MTQLTELDGDLLELCNGGWGGNYGGLDPLWGETNSSWTQNLSNFFDNPFSFLSDSNVLAQGACMIPGKAGEYLGVWLSGFTGAAMPVTAPLFGWAGNAAASAACMYFVENGTYELPPAQISDIVAP